MTKKLEKLPLDLHAEFPDVPLDALEHDVDRDARVLLSSARFNDFVPLLVHRAVRERLLGSH